MNFVRFAGIAGWILLVIFGVFEEIYLANRVWDGISIIDWLLPLIGVIIGFLTALLIIRPEPWMEKIISGSQNALSLSELPIIQEADRHTAEAKTIVLNSGGIFFFDRQNYNFFTARFADYKLGDLQNQDQLKMLGYYFRQQYSGIFKYSAKVDATYINSLNATSVGGAYTSISTTSMPVSAELKQIAFERIG